MHTKISQSDSADRVNLGLFNRKIEYPNLIEAQQTSFQWFLENGFQKLFSEISPVKDTMERMWTLNFKDFRYGQPHRKCEEAVKKVFLTKSLFMLQYSF
jgi:DNA-directed RNA polymerase beta subunit